MAKVSPKVSTEASADGPASLASRAPLERGDDIFVTQPFLPPLDEFLPLVEQIWRRRILTNDGPLNRELEGSLLDFLEVPYLSLVSNGTLALQLALKAAELQGEVITTPYSFVATTHAIMLNGLTPVFADIRASDYNIDPAAIEAAITPRTTGILSVHCYGNPCDVVAIQKIADRHGLTVIYDAAHAFGVRTAEQSLLKYGDYSTLSFHATKAFSTFEGGAVVGRTEEAKQAVDLLRNFGIESETNVSTIGTNAKLNEISSAFGLLQLRWFSYIREQRSRVHSAYMEALSDVSGIRIMEIPKQTYPNFSYFPIEVEDSFPLSRDELYEYLKERRVFCRRYFYPLLSNLSMYKDFESANAERLPVANRAAGRVLCLPIFPDLDSASQGRVIGAIISASRA